MRGEALNIIQGGIGRMVQISPARWELAAQWIDMSIMTKLLD
jgi:hypothetical protein